MKKRSSGLLSADNLFYDTVSSPLGVIFLVFKGNIMVMLQFSKPSCRRGRGPERGKAQLTSYFQGKLKAFTIETEFIAGTDFERDVWSLLKKVPYGETRSYKWVAGQVGRPRAVRAVGQALKKNPLPILFPCHRIIESSSALGGYSSGVDVKRRLLEMEYYFSLK